MTQRYDRQIGLIGVDGQRALLDSCVAVIGCGGLGSIVIADLVSAGVGRFILIDGDIVSESNLNRQFIHAGKVGMKKVDSARQWIHSLDPDCDVLTYDRFLSIDDVPLLDGADVVVDCLDSSVDRLVLSKLCIDSGNVLVHAAVEGYHGQVAVIRPEDSLRLEHIYPKPTKGVVHDSIATSVTTVGSIQANEVIKVLLGSDKALRDELLTLDLLENSIIKYHIFG